jgi:hypothetical protein
MLLSLVVFTSLPSTAEAARIWFERGVASVTTGYEVQTRTYIHRKFYLVAHGPDSLQAGHDLARTCTAQVTTRVVEDFRRQLWAIKLPEPAETETSPSKETLEAAGASRDKTVDRAVDAATSAFKAEMSTCSRRRFDASVFQLGLIQRVCDRSGACRNASAAFADHPAAVAFTVLALWVDARDGDTPTLPANQLVLFPDLVDAKKALQTLGTARPSEALSACHAASVQTARGIVATGATQTTCVALEMAARPFKESSRWPDPKPAAVVQAQLEALVVRARKDKRRIERSVPRVLDMPREVAVRLIDVIDEPQEALLDLKSDASRTLLTMSDELARARITECARLRGLTDVGRVSECAGYKLDVSTMDACLANAKCTPHLGDRGWRGALVVFETEGRKRLSQDALLPRLGNKTTEYANLVAQARNCAKAGSRAAAAECALAGQLGEREQKAWQCVRGRTARQLDDRTIECALGGSLPANVKETLDCGRKHKRAEDQAFCAASTALPPEATDLLECQRAHKSDAQQVGLCVVKKNVGGDAAKVAMCVKEGGGDWSKAALCYAGASKLPPAAAQAVQCMQKSGSDASSVAGCMATNHLPASIRKPAQCLAESGGDPLGAGVCMASEGMTADQRIALQCLATTGGEPTSFATCTGGRLLVKEIFNCVDKKLFEDKCMGEGNEIRKLLKGLGINLTPSTVVGQVLNAPVDLIKFQVAFAQAAGKGIEKFAHNVGRETERAAQNIEREIARGVQNVGREAQRIGDRAKRDLDNGIKAVSRATRIRLPF